MKERRHRTGIGARPREHDPMSWTAAIDGEQFPGDRLVVPLFFLADAIVVGMLAPSAGAILIAVEALASRALCSEAGQLASLERGNLEDAGTGPVQHHGQQPTELFLYRGQLAHQWTGVNRQSRSVHHRKSDRLEEFDRFAGEDRNSLCRWKIAGRSEKLLNPVQVPMDRFDIRTIESDAG
jgi:hypothetical protein